jgi:hypothetical protein
MLCGVLFFFFHQFRRYGNILLELLKNLILNAIWIAINFNYLQCGNSFKWWIFFRNLNYSKHSLSTMNSLGKKGRVGFFSLISNVFFSLWNPWVDNSNMKGMIQNQVFWWNQAVMKTILWNMYFETQKCYIYARINCDYL